MRVHPLRGKSAQFAGSAPALSGGLVRKRSGRPPPGSEPTCGPTARRVAMLRNGDQGERATGRVTHRTTSCVVLRFAGLSQTHPRHLGASSCDDQQPQCVQGRRQVADSCRQQTRGTRSDPGGWPTKGWLRALPKSHSEGNQNHQDRRDRNCQPTNWPIRPTDNPRPHR